MKKYRRSFVDDQLVIDSFESVEKYLTLLLDRNLDSAMELRQWLKDKSELEAVLEEDMAWRYIRMSIDTANDAHQKAYTFFVTEIQPKLAPMEDALNKKFISCPFHEELAKEEAFTIHIRSVKSQLELYREENITIQSFLAEKTQEFGAISGAQSIEHDGESITMQKAGLFLKEQDETLRRSVFQKMATRRSQDIGNLDKLFDALIRKRTELAKNAGFKNYRDYKFKEMGRFDYTKESCFEFHDSVEQHIVPLVKKIQKERLRKMDKEIFKPWDTAVNAEGKAPLRPFETGQEMLDGTISVFNKIHPEFSGFLKTMEEMKHFDLESKPGKAPGGYNYPLYETGAPFIFMNAVGSQGDLSTMIHEGGHAVHSFLTHELELTAFKSFPSEIAELASMSMELLSMEFWDEFYDKADDLKRAKKEQLQGTITILPWIAQVDAFQHWIYENHEHTATERTKHWMELNKRFGTGLVDWTGHELTLASSWQRQMHLFEVPFYYIEYGIAQLGAIGVWRNSKTDFKEAVDNYRAALSLGYTKSMPEVYAKAGIDFNFSGDHICMLADFVELELEKLGA